MTVYHIQISGPGWERGESEAGLRFPKASTQFAGERTRLIISDDGGMKLEEHGGKCLLSSAPGRFFGQCGPASIFEFLRQEGDLFYGMGEKWTRNSSDWFGPEKTVFPELLWGRHASGGPGKLRGSFAAASTEHGST